MRELRAAETVNLIVQDRTDPVDMMADELARQAEDTRMPEVPEEPDAPPDPDEPWRAAKHWLAWRGPYDLLRCSGVILLVARLIDIYGSTDLLEDIGLDISWGVAFAPWFALDALVVGVLLTQLSPEPHRRLYFNEQLALRSYGALLGVPFGTALKVAIILYDGGDGDAVFITGCCAVAAAVACCLYATCVSIHADGARPLLGLLLLTLLAYFLLAFVNFLRVAGFADRNLLNNTHDYDSGVWTIVPDGSWQQSLMAGWLVLAVGLVLTYSNFWLTFVVHPDLPRPARFERARKFPDMLLITGYTASALLFCWYVDDRWPLTPESGGPHDKPVPWWVIWPLLLTEVLSLAYTIVCATYLVLKCPEHVWHNLPEEKVAVEFATQSGYGEQATPGYMPYDRGDASMQQPYGGDFAGPPPPPSIAGAPPPQVTPDAHRLQQAMSRRGHPSHHGLDTPSANFGRSMRSPRPSEVREATLGRRPSHFYPTGAKPAAVSETSFGASPSRRRMSSRAPPMRNPDAAALEGMRRQSARRASERMPSQRWGQAPASMRGFAPPATTAYDHAEAPASGRTPSQGTFEMVSKIMTAEEPGELTANPRFAAHRAAETWQAKVQSHRQEGGHGGPGALPVPDYD